MTLSSHLTETLGSLSNAGICIVNPPPFLPPPRDWLGPLQRPGLSRALLGNLLIGARDTATAGWAHWPCTCRFDTETQMKSISAAAGRRRRGVTGNARCVKLCERSEKFALPALIIVPIVKQWMYLGRKKVCKKYENE